jgi:predicted enzyme related to lactoylglutathione lyase
MTTVDKHEPGRFCWAELSTTDISGGRAFYESLFGWKGAAQPAGEMGEYVVFSLADGRPAAGGYEQPEQERSMGFPPHWNLYIYSDDVDKTVAKSVEAGGKAVVQPMDTPNGRMAVVADPTGAIFCLWQSDSMPGWAVRDEPGSFSWPELISNDVERAAKFYSDVFDWTVRRESMGDGPPYTLFHQGDRDVGGAFPPPMPDIPNYWNVYFDVSSAADTVAKAKKLGGDVLQEPMEIPDVGTFAVMVDPTKAVFAILEAKPGGRVAE